MKPNIVLITIDSLRADLVGIFNESSKIEGLTDNIDRWSEGAVRFSSAFSQGANSSPSFLSLLSGCYPSRFGDWYSDVSRQRPLVSEVLNAKGYYTCAFNSNPNTSSYFGYDKGFDSFTDYLPKNKTKKLFKKPTFIKLFESLCKKPYVSGTQINGDVLSWLQEEREVSPYFLWFHYMDVHGPYFSHDGWDFKNNVSGLRLWLKAIRTPEKITPHERKVLLSTCREEIRFTDKLVGEVLERFDDETLVILLADHGDLFGEHGLFGHRLFLYEEMLHVPLLIKFPKSFNVPPSVHESNVGLMDVVPTILDFLGIESEIELDGTSLKPAILNEKPADTERAIISEVSRKYLCIRSGRWKLSVDYRTDEKVLTDLRADPQEDTDLSEQESEIAEKLKRQVLEHIDRNAKNSSDTDSNRQKIDSEITFQLKALGYVKQKDHVEDL